MTEKGKGTALPLAFGTIPIYIDLHPSQLGRPVNKKKCSTFLHIQEGTLSRVSRNTQFLFPPIIPLQTSHTRARVSHIIRVKSKSISYHTFPFSFPLALFLHARQGEKEHSVSTQNQSFSQELTAWNPLPDYLPDIALEYLSSTSYVSRKDTTSDWGTDRASEKDTRKHVDASATEHVPIHLLLCQRQKYPISSRSNTLDLMDLF
ncbi:hypothetical protein ACFX13_044599 [Malus domestica]